MSWREPASAAAREAARRARRGRAWRPLAALVVCAGIAIAVLGDGASTGAEDNGKARRRAAYRDTFPAGAGREIAERSCTSCHSPMLITQQAKDSTGWEKTVTQMERWGAPFGHHERDTLVTYLRAAFPPRGERTAK